MATLAYLVFVIYGSWVPLNFSPLPLTEAFQRFVNLPFGDQAIESATDWATNSILLIPFTFLLGQRIKHGLPGSGKLLSVVLAVAAGVALALFLEFSQIYFPPRTVSQKDILALCLGGMLGATAQLRWGHVVEHWLETLWQSEQGRSGLIRMLHAYLLVVLLFSVLPLDLTVSLVEIYHKWDEGRVVLVPFGGLKGGLGENVYELASDVLLWLPVGLLLAMERRTTMLQTAVLAGLLALVIELAQLFVYSRVTDITDPLLAAVGGGIGGYLARREHKLQGLIGRLAPAFWYRAWVVWVVAMIAVFWFPYDFVIRADLLERAQEMLTRLPFLTLYQGTEFRAINEIIRKIALFAPGGMLWGMAIAQAHGISKPQARAGLLLMVMLASAIEFGQLLLPGKVADTTDILLFAIGGWLGLRLIGALRSANWQTLKLTEQQVVPQERQAATSTPTRAASGLSITRVQIIAFAAISVGLAILIRLPGVPYNIKELVAPGIAGLLSITGIVLALLWLINGHFLLLRNTQSAHRVLLFLPIWLVVHALVTWTLLRIGVPLESIHDIVGSPVLGWVWELEMIGRYVALHSAYASALIGAILLTAGICGKGQKRLVAIWAGWCLLLAWPLHAVIVDYAATDNLTELMREGGRFQYAFLLFLGAFLASLTATLLASLPTQRSGLLVKGTMIPLAAAGAIACLWFGCEPMIIKYEKVFSAWQFLLSPDRNHYITGLQLWLHFAVAFAAYIGIVAILHYPLWKKMPSSTSGRNAGRRHRGRSSNMPGSANIPQKLTSEDTP